MFFWMALACLQAEPQTATFNRTVAPILWQHCATCHRPGEVGPFALLTFADAKKRAAQIIERVEAGAMPPWIPSAESLPFAGERRLSATEKRTLRDWLTAGAPQGDAKELGTPPIFHAGWQLGTPDLIVEMPESYVVPADGPDLFRNFVVSTASKDPRWIRAIELRPDNGRVVHHAEVLVDKSSSARRLDAREPGVGFASRTAGQAAKPQGFFLGWTPGKLPREQPAGLAWRLAPGADLVLQLHLVPTGKPESLRVKVGLWFAPRAPERRPVLARLGSTVIDIPAGEANYAIADQFTLPVAVELLSIYPHAHFLGHLMSADAILPDGKRTAVLRIDDWDFKWQDEYRLAQPLELPAGSRIEMRYTYDNSAQNPRNPATTPRRVTYGPNSSDEMGDLWACLLARDGADTAKLEGELARRDANALRAGIEASLALNPDSVIGHLSRGSMLLDEGKPERAAEEFKIALRLDPQCADAQFNLGVMAQDRGDFAGAVREFDGALKSSPFYPEAWNNRGLAMLNLQDLVGAIESFEQALEQDPEYPDAHFNLGMIKARARDMPGARARFERALAIDPEHVEATFNLGNVSLQSGDRARALVLYRRTLLLSPAHAGATAMLAKLEPKAK